MSDLASVGEMGVTTEGVTDWSMIFPESSRDSISYERGSFLRSSSRASTETNSLLFRLGDEINISRQPVTMDQRPRRRQSQMPFIWRKEKAVSNGNIGRKQVRSANYPEKEKNGANGGHVHYQYSGFVKARPLVSTILKKAGNPRKGESSVFLDLFDRVVLEDENDREEDDVGDNDENDGDASPLERNHASHAAVSLFRGHGPDAVGVGWQVGTLGRGGVVGE